MRTPTAAVLFSQAADAFPRLRHVRADQGYRGADFHAWVQEATGITKDYEYLRVCSQNAVYLTMAMFLVRCLARSAR